MVQDRIGEAERETSFGDRRRSHREPVVTVGTLRATDAPRSAGQQVLVNDVSLHGVGIRTTFSLDIGEFFLIEIGVGPLHLSSRLRVARVRELKDGTYDIGGEFC
jgi:PilZ domain-containing protein